MRPLMISVLVAGCSSHVPTSTPDAASADGHDPASGAVEDLATGITEPSSLAVDATHVFFVDGPYNISRVVKTGGVIEPVVTNQRYPASLDATTDRLYWVNTGTHPAEFHDGSVSWAAKTGGSSHEVVASYFPSALAVDAANNTIYWVEIDGQSVRKIQPDGQGELTLDHAATEKTSIALSPSQIVWTASGAGADVVSLDRASGVAQTLSSDEYAASSALIVAGDVYWSVQHALSDDGAIRVSRAAGPPTDLVANEFHPENLIHSGQMFYWISGDQIRQVSLTGGPATTLVGNRGQIYGLATDDAYVYWSEPQRGAIVRLKL